MKENTCIYYFPKTTPSILYLFKQIPAIVNIKQENFPQNNGFACTVGCVS